MNKTKIILFRGGHAGDLFTAIHDLTCFIEITIDGKVEISKDRKLLQVDSNLTFAEKDEYLQKHNIISCVDSEFALKHHKQTLVIKCDNPDVSAFFSARQKKFHPHYFTNTTLEKYIEDVLAWNKFWPTKFKKQLDISDIFTNENFLSKLDIEISKDKKDIFEHWLSINKKIFLDQTTVSNQ